MASFLGFQDYLVPKILIVYVCNNILKMLTEEKNYFRLQIYDTTTCYNEADTLESSK